MATLKKVYFVRHGESTANVKGAPYTGPSAELTEKGMKQAETVARRFANIPIDTIITSTISRAKVTGDIISQHTGVPVADSIDTLVEFEFPVEAMGFSIDDKEYKEVVGSFRKKFVEQNGPYSTEETFTDLKERMAEALRYLENRPEKNILVVSHGKFTRSLMGYVCLGNLLTPEILMALDEAMRSSNTGITHMELTEERWRVWQWNDSAHLGELTKVSIE